MKRNSGQMCVSVCLCLFLRCHIIFAVYGLVLSSLSLSHRLGQCIPISSEIDLGELEFVVSFFFLLLLLSFALTRLHFGWVRPKESHFCFQLECRCNIENSLNYQMQKRCRIKCWFCVGSCNDNDVLMCRAKVSVHKRIETHTRWSNHMYKVH